MLFAAVVDTGRYHSVLEDTLTTISTSIKVCWYYDTIGSNIMSSHDDNITGMNDNTKEESGNEDHTAQDVDEGYGGNTNNNNNNDNINSNNDNMNNNEDQTNDGDGTSSHYMEGYTPLNFNMNALAGSGMLLDDDSSDSDNDNDDNYISNNIMDGEFDTGYYHNLDGPPKRLNGVKDNVMLGFSTMPPDDDDEDNNDISSNNIDDSGNSEHINSVSESLDIPADFQLLAEQALRGLEVEHISTLERSMDSMVNTTTTATADLPPSDMTSASNDDTKQSSTDLFEATFPSIDEDNEMQLNDDQKASSLAFATSSTQALEQDISRPITLPKIHLKQPKGMQSSRPMDVNAIQKAMKSIRLKSPQLATTLDEGSSTSFSTSTAHTATDAALNTIIKSTISSIETSQQQQQQKLASHAIIPLGPLAAFRRNTPKAQSASSNLTRSATLSDAVLRLWPIITFRRKMRTMGLSGTIITNPSSSQSTTTLVIHIIGADGVECSSEELVRKSVGSFVRWIDAALSSGVLSHEKTARLEVVAQLDRIDSLLIEFSGPNMPSVLVGKDMDLLPDKMKSSNGGLISAKATFQQREYHEDSTGDNNTTADLVIAFNAGIWGYDSWKPTIASMMSSASSGRPGIGETLFIITAYTVEECEDDAEVIAQVVEETALSKKNNTSILGRQVWGPESNQFASRLERKTASAPPGRKYFENGAWQAWLLG